MKGKSVTIITRLPVATMLRVREIAAAEDRSLSSVIRRLVVKGLELDRVAHLAQS